MTGNDLKRLREELKLTQAQLATKLRYNSQTYIARLEARGDKPIPEAVEYRLATLLLRESTPVAPRRDYTKHFEKLLKQIRDSLTAS